MIVLYDDSTYVKADTEMLHTISTRARANMRARRALLAGVSKQEIQRLADVLRAI